MLLGILSAAFSKAHFVEIRPFPDALMISVRLVYGEFSYLPDLLTKGDASRSPASFDLKT